MFEMSIAVKDVDNTLDNPDGYLYIKGNEGTNGSVRLSYVGGDNENAVVEVREDGAWINASLKLGGNSLYMGKNIHLHDVGGYLTVTDIPRDIQRETVVHEYDDTGSISQIHDYLYDPVEIKYMFQSDQSGEWSGTDYTATETISISAIRSKYYFKMGATVPTDDLVMNIYYGTGTGGHLMATHTVDYTTLSANTEFDVTLTNADAAVSFTEGEDITVQILCASTFSVKADVTNTYIWHGADIQRWYPKRVSRENVIWKTANYTACNNELIECDTDAVGTFTVTAPANPKTGWFFTINDWKSNFHINKLIVSFAGSKFDSVADATHDCDKKGSHCMFAYVDDTIGWTEILEQKADGLDDPDFCRLTITTDVPLSSGVWTEVTWNSEISDDNDMHTAGQPEIDIPTNGIYLVTTNAGFEAGGTPTTGIRIYKGASLVVASYLGEAAYTGEKYINASTVVKCVAGDEITIQVMQQAGVTKDLLANEGKTNVTVTKL